MSFFLFICFLIAHLSAFWGCRVTQRNDNQLHATRHNDTQHNYTQLKDTQHNDTQHNDTQHYDT
jgi:hypothetical protein